MFVGADVNKLYHFSLNISTVTSPDLLFDPVSQNSKSHLPKWETSKIQNRRAKKMLMFGGGEGRGVHMEGNRLSTAPTFEKISTLLHAPPKLRGQSEGRRCTMLLYIYRHIYILYIYIYIFAVQAYIDTSTTSTGSSSDGPLARDI